MSNVTPMRMLLAATAAVLALTPSADAAVHTGTATAVFHRTGANPTRVLAGYCTWDGAVLVGFATSFGVSPNDALDINVRCVLSDAWGATLAEVHEGSAGPPVQGATVAALPNNRPARLCGWSNAYFRGGSSLSASGCATPVTV